MIVIDASAMVEALVGRLSDPSVLEALAGQMSAPHLLDAEVLSVLRGLTLSGKLPVEIAERARHDFFELTVERFEIAPLADRIWALRHRYTSYDAAYIALAEALDAPLVTADAELGAGGHTARVQLLRS